MLKKILVTIIEIALIALVIYSIVTVLNGVQFADAHEMTPWCVTEIKH